MQTSIEIVKVRVILGKDFEALKDISVNLLAGEITGVIGPSGAGKTTLIRSIVGRQRIASGSINVLGELAGSKSLRSKVSYMTQEVSIYEDLTVAENLKYFATMLNIPKGDIKSEVFKLLELVDLVRQENQVAGKLSGGQKQRVSLAIALLGSPQVLVLDEPTVGLDPLLREHLWKLFRRLAESGKTLIVSSHVMDEAERCDELLLIRNGVILAQGSPRELCKRTNTNSVEESFLKLVGERE